ncbi:MAG: EscU/YscU/HrcU family type III secretion system export apparatus switch protein [Deltaproteobacteria bacterium]|nr:EscU/YscU/HrcU family type III secretion system export apparatus switch protein [Deltaproteobacteria bacterium]
MADREDHDPESATEEASPKRLDQLREQGQLAKSAELTAVVSLVVGVGVLLARLGSTSSDLREVAIACFSLRDHARPMSALAMMGDRLASSLVPIAVASAIAAIVAGLAQTRGFVSLDQLGRNFEQLDPIAGLGRALPGKDTLLEVGKMLLKVLVVGAVTYVVTRDALPRLVLLARLPILGALVEARDVVRVLLERGLVALVLLAILDLVLAKRRFDTEHRMSKKELADEHKEEEGDPKIKAKRRARAAKVARQRAVSEVKNATVLVVNPTHIAIALRYEAGRDAAPMVLAKGADEIALRMKEEARARRVPILEDRPLARAMYASAKAGRPIPVELYEAVARVIAHVMRIRARLAPEPIARGAAS